jgi:hypothetical protein
MASNTRSWIVRSELLKITFARYWLCCGWGQPSLPVGLESEGDPDAVLDCMIAFESIQGFMVAARAAQQ